MDGRAGEVGTGSAQPGRGPVRRRAGGDGITVEYIPRAEAGPGVLDEVGTRLRTAIGEDIAITWVPVDRIPDTPSGKPQIIRPAPADGASG